MKNKLLTISYVLLLLNISGFAQDLSQPKNIFINRNYIGIQLNPYLDENLFRGFAMLPVYGIKYGYKISKPIIIGAELSGFFPYLFGNTQRINQYNVNIGLLARYTVNPENRVQGFLEVSPYYAYRLRKAVQNFPVSKENKLGFYFAPGITIYSKTKKFSYDFYYKFSNLTFVNGKKSVFSYKVNYNF